MEFSKEQIEKARNCKTLDEFKLLAKAEGVELSDEEAENCFKQTRVGELTDNDLATVAGGSKGDPKPKYNIGEKVRDTRKPMVYGRDYWSTGVVISRSYTCGDWLYTIENNKRTKNVFESYLERVTE